jgi:hypothetical protein
MKKRMGIQVRTKFSLRQLGAILTKPVLLLVALLLVFSSAGVACAGGGGGGGGGTATTMAEVNQQLMNQTTDQMNSAAQELGVTLPSGTPIPGMAYAAASSAQNVAVAGAPLAGLGNVTETDLTNGAVLGLFYLSGISGVPDGFYKLKVTMEKLAPTDVNLTPIVRFIDKFDNVVLQSPATMSTPIHEAAEPTIGVGVDVLARPATAILGNTMDKVRPLAEVTVKIHVSIDITIDWDWIHIKIHEEFDW